MNRPLKSLILACLSVGFSSAFADPPENYYAAATGQTGGQLKNTLHGIISNHTVIPYPNLIAPLIDVWRDPNDSENLLLIYSNTSVPSSSSWNREHIWPRSRGNSEQMGPDDSDLFHVFPSDIAVNAERGSLYFDESDPGDPFYRIPAHPLAPQTSRDSDSFQPPPQERGDIARAIFYMDVRYDGQEPFTSDMEIVSFPPSGAQMGRLNTLLLWHQQDPPDAAERARNDRIFSTYQNNRNPFIDHPEYVEAIWGVGLPGGGGSRPIAKIGTVTAAAIESPATHASFLVSLNQFAGTGGLTVGFLMSGTASLNDYSISGTGVTYDASTGLGTVLIPANFSSVLVTLTPTSDGIVESAETAIVSLSEGSDYTVVPDASSQAVLSIFDTPSLPSTWNFNSGIPYANPLQANTGAGAISFTGWRGTIASFSGSSGLSIALVGSAGNNSWIDLNISMTGYTNLTLNFSTRGTSSGYNSGTWSASVDGVTFTQLAGVNTATQNTVFSSKVVDFSGIPILTDAPNVTLRYTLSGATSTNGNNRIDELTVTASPLVTGNAPRTVSLAAVDTSANETTLDPGTFLLQLNGSAPVGGLEVALFFGSGTAISPGRLDSDYMIGGLSSYDSISQIGTVFIAEGVSAAVVTVTPVTDAISEGPETIIANLQTSANYLVGNNTSAIITILSPLLNDPFAGAFLLAGDTAEATGANVGATRETGEPYHLSGSQTGGRSVWWQWTAPADGILKLVTDGSNFDTIMGLYVGSNLNALQQISSDDDSGAGLASMIITRVNQGVNYFIAVDGYGQSVGSIVLGLNFQEQPTLSISAPNPQAKERGSIPATVRFSLSSVSLLPTIVSFSQGGTATVATDYSTSSASLETITIPAGASFVDLIITPMRDTNLVELTETIEVALLPTGQYRLDTESLNAATVFIQDDSPYSAAWLTKYPGLTAESSGLSEDTDQDGIPLLLEYLGDLNPLVSDGTSLLRISLESIMNPELEIEEAVVRIRLVRRQDANEIPLVLEGSESLSAGSWVTLGSFISAIQIENTDREELLFQFPVSPTLPNSFFRVRASVP